MTAYMVDQKPFGKNGYFPNLRGDRSTLQDKALRVELNHDFAVALRDCSQCDLVPTYSSDCHAVIASRYGYLPPSDSARTHSHARNRVTGIDWFCRAQLARFCPAPQPQEQRDTPNTHALAFEERPALLVDHGRLSRQNSRYRGLLRDARLKVAQACIEDVDYKSSCGLDKVADRCPGRRRLDRVRSELTDD